MLPRASAPLRAFLQLPDRARRLGAFQLIHQLGRGGFAPVWLAREVYGETELRTAAVKLFAFEDGGVSRARIIDEARALCQVEHPNIVRFYALPTDEARGVMGLAMEYVAGAPLDRRLEQRGRLPLGEALAVGLAVSSALAAVHRAGLVHRDVKPANVVEAAGVYKLIDFGIASAERAEAAGPRPGAARRVLLDDLPLELVGTRLSQLPGAVALDPSADEDPGRPAVTGTVGYIDPECVGACLPAAPASDLYGVGALLFECLTGGLPAAAASGEGGGLRGEVLDGRAAPPALATLAPDLPRALGELVDALLQPARKDRPRSAERVVLELERLQRGLEGSPRALPPESAGPFRGLGRFEAADRDVYFGRSAEVAAALEVLRGRGFLSLVGSSGSGKSSLARAGLLPRIEDGALGGWPPAWDTATASPGSDPRLALGAALAPFVAGAAKLGPEQVLLALGDRAQVAGRGVCLFVDQLEELVTLAREGESRAWACALLAQVGDQPVPGLRVVVAARRDLLAPLLSLGPLGRALVRGTMLVSPLSDGAWGEVIDQALSSYGYGLEDEALRAELLAELRGTEAAMPLVQFALTQLWHERDAGRRLVTRAGLRAIGGIAGALERHAEATIRRIEALGPGAVEAAQDALLSLTTPEGTRATRTPLELMARLRGRHAEAVLAELESARLVVREAHGLTLAHEALLSQWRRLRGWLEEAESDRVLEGEIERDAARWGARPDPTLLWKKRRLSAAEELGERRGARLSTEASAFVRAGRAEERRGRALAFALGLSLLLAAAAGGGLYVVRIEAEKRQRDAALAAAQASERRATQAATEAELARTQKVSTKV